MTFNDRRSTMMTKLSGVSMVAVALASAAVLQACDNGTDNGSGDVAIQDPVTPFPADPGANSGDATKACTPPRSDVFSFVTLGTGSWGSWQACYTYCPAGSFAYSASLRSEVGQGAGDDSALNGIQFNCYDRTSGAYMGFIRSHAGFWGTWGTTAVSNPYVVSNPFVGGQMKIEAPQGIDDDTAANTAQLKAMNGVWSTPSANTGWGSWQAAQSCPAGQAICGVNTRVEGQQGTGDDTALNGIALACCGF
jgi:hypothetical protein